MECSPECIYRKALSSRSYSKILNYVADKKECTRHPLCLIQCILSSLRTTSLDTVVKLTTTYFYNDLNKYRDSEGSTLLNLLATKMIKYNNVVRIILTSKIDINATDANGYTFLMNLVEYKKHSLLLDIVINIELQDLNYDFNHKANDGHTLLSLFCKYISEYHNTGERVNGDKMIKLLLDKGCDPNVSSPMKYIIHMNNIKELILDSGYLLSEEDMIEPNRSYLDNIVIPCIKKLRRKHKIIGMRGILTDGTIIGAKKSRSWLNSFLNQRETSEWEELCSYIGNSYISDLRTICNNLNIPIDTSDDMYEDTYYNKKVRYRINGDIHVKVYKKLKVRYYAGDHKVSIRHKIMKKELELKNKIKYVDRLATAYNTETMLGTPIEDIIPSRYITESSQCRYYAFELAEVEKLIDMKINPYNRQSFSKSFISKANTMIRKCKGKTSNEGYLPMEFDKSYKEADNILYSSCNPLAARYLIDKINDIVSMNSPDYYNFSSLITADITECLSVLRSIYYNRRCTNLSLIEDILRESNVDIARYKIFSEIYRHLTGPDSVTISLILSSIYRSVIT